MVIAVLRVLNRVLPLCHLGTKVRLLISREATILINAPGMVDNHRTPHVVVQYGPQHVMVNATDSIPLDIHANYLALFVNT